MDEKLSKLMVNGNLLCENLTPKFTKVGGFEIKTEERFNELKVLESSETDILKGDTVLVKYGVGTKYLDHLIVNRGNVIAIY